MHPFCYVLLLLLGLMPKSVAVEQQAAVVEESLAKNEQVTQFGGATLAIGSGTAIVGNTICVPVTVNGFVDIYYWQASLAYNSTVLQFEGAQNIALPGMTPASFSELNPGEISFVWQEPSGTGLTFLNETVLFELCFTVIEAGESTVAFSDNPTPFLMVNGEVEEVLLSLFTGTITAEATVAFNVNSLVIPVGDVGCLSIEVEDFSAATTDLFFSFNNDLVQFSTSQNINLPGLTNADFIEVSPGRLSVQWSSSTGDLVNLPDGAVLFDLCFEGLAVGTTNLALGHPNPDQLLLDENDNPIAYTTNTGEIIVTDIENGFCNATRLDSQAVDNEEHNCCWQLNFNNLDPEFAPYAIEVIALNNETFDFTLASGYFAPDYDANSVLISTNPFGPMPENQIGLAEVCFEGSLNDSKELLVKYYNNQYEVTCQALMQMECPGSSACMLLLEEAVVCGPENLSLSVLLGTPFLGGQPVSLVKLNITAPPALVGEYMYEFSEPLLPGEEVAINIELPMFSPMTIDNSISYILTAHNGPGEEQCCLIIENTLPFPECAPCSAITTQVVLNENDDCCFDVFISNEFIYDNFFQGITFSLLNENFPFENVTLSDDWNGQLTADDLTLKTLHESGFVPSDIIDSPIFSFCFTEAALIDSVLMTATWNNPMAPCVQDLSFICQDCFIQESESIICDEIAQNYAVKLGGINVTEICEANMVRIVNESDLFTIPENLIDLLVTVGPNEFYDNLNFTIIPTGLLGGEEACIELIFENHLPDGTIIACCSVPYCVEVPVCEFEDGYCVCTDIIQDVSCGFEAVINCYELTLTPSCLLDDCDQVIWNLDGVPVGNSAGTAPFIFPVPADGDYEFTMNVTRTLPDGSSCEERFRETVTVPFCNDPGCSMVSCTAPANVEISCNDLPANFDPTNTDDLQALFGMATLNGDCPDASVVELSPNVILDNCGAGTIMRTFETDNGSGITSTCGQIVEIVIAGTSDYSIKLPPDGAGNCVYVSTLQPEIFTDGCADFEIEIEEQEIDPLFNQCRTIERIIRIKNLCEYDGFSDPIIISRDEACFDDEGSEETWIVLIDGVTYTDEDSNPSNNIPNQGESEPDCFGQTNPMGYWRNSNEFPELSSNGYWQYTQYASIASLPVNLDIPEDEDLCLNPNTCLAPFSFPLTVVNHCIYAEATIQLFYDENDDGTEEVILEVAPNGTISYILGEPGFLTVSGELPDYIFTINYPIGTHETRLRGTSDCGNGFSSNFFVTVTDCDASPINCFANINATIVEGTPPTVAVSAIDLISDTPIPDCTSPLTFSINRLGETVDPMQENLTFDCADLGEQAVEVHAWDAAGNSSTCNVLITVQDPNALCQQPIIIDDPGIVLRPNPTAEDLVISTNHFGSAVLSITSLDNKIMQYEMTIIGFYPKIIKVSHLLPGIYYLQLNYDDGTRLIAPFVKM